MMTGTGVGISGIMDAGNVVDIGRALSVRNQFIGREVGGFRQVMHSVDYAYRMRRVPEQVHSDDEARKREGGWRDLQPGWLNMQDG
jgi:lysyl-tRNA synthetase class I